MGFWNFHDHFTPEFRVVLGNFLRLGSGAEAAAEGVRGAEAQEGLAGCAAVHSESATRARGAGSVVDLFLSRSSSSAPQSSHSQQLGRLRPPAPPTGKSQFPSKA